MGGLIFRLSFQRILLILVSLCYQSFMPSLKFYCSTGKPAQCQKTTRPPVFSQPRRKHAATLEIRPLPVSGLDLVTWSWEIGILAVTAGLTTLHNLTITLYLTYTGCHNFLKLNLMRAYHQICSNILWSVPSSSRYHSASAILPRPSMLH